MKITINYKPDIPTLNNRIYPRNVVENMMGKKVPVTFGTNGRFDVDVKDIIGFCTLSLEDDDIVGVFEPVAGENIDILQFCEWSTSCIANMSDNIIQDGCKLMSVFAILDPQHGERMTINHLPDNLFEVD